MFLFLFHTGLLFFLDQRCYRSFEKWPQCLLQLLPRVRTEDASGHDELQGWQRTVHLSEQSHQVCRRATENHVSVWWLSEDRKIQMFFTLIVFDNFRCIIIALVSKIKIYNWLKSWCQFVCVIEQVHNRFQNNRRTDAHIHYITSLPAIFGIKKYAECLMKIVNERFETAAHQFLLFESYLSISAVLFQVIFQNVCC